jgi:hypothetical protein
MPLRRPLARTWTTKTTRNPQRHGTARQTSSSGELDEQGCAVSRLGAVQDIDAAVFFGSDSATLRESPTPAGNSDVAVAANRTRAKSPTASGHPNRSVEWLSVHIVMLPSLGVPEKSCAETNPFARNTSDTSHHALYLEAR